ncbi:MAG: hypothetical protein EG824_04285 [Deltaproteobacteria bacterium]|nr:hypothetical protein [Deltaproteobacteria bacterium]
MRVTLSKLIASPRFFLLVAWVLTISWLSLTPAPPAPEVPLFGYDKLFHAAAYASLTLLAGWTFSGIISLSGRLWLLIASSAIVIGGLLEIAQAWFTVTRKAEAADFIANCVGAGIALLAARIATIRRRTRQARVKAQEKR